MWPILIYSPRAKAALYGALTGWVASAATDYHAFLTWKSFGDVREYNWGTALFRWIQGALSGALTGAGLGSLLG